MAKLIEVERQGNQTALRVNGETFPWHVAPGMDVHIERGASPSITLTILADEVRVVDRFAPLPPPEVDWLLKHAETDAAVARIRTGAPVLEDDIVTAPDGGLWRIKRKDSPNCLLHVVPYTR